MYHQPPWNYDCIYKNCCPHLQGLSTTWVFNEYQQSSMEHLDHWKIRDEQQEELEKANAYIKELENKNEALKAKLKALHQKQFKTNKKVKQHDSTTTDMDQVTSKKKKTRGAPKGHPGWRRRRPDHIDHTIIVPAPEVCPYCNWPDLKPVKKLKDHLQEDIILNPRTYVTNFRHHQAFCPKCRRPVIKAAKNELLNCHIGPTTKAAAIFLRYGLNLPYRKVKEFFEVFFDMPFVPASAMNFDRTATLKGQPLYEDLKEKVRVAAIAHADETSWRQDGIGHYLWYAGNPEMAFYHIDRHRSSQVAQSILGDEFQGVLNTDGYAAYNSEGQRDQTGNLTENTKISGPKICSVL